MSIPKIIHYCWFGKNPMPNTEIKFIESWKCKLHDYQFILWNEDNFDINSVKFTKQVASLKKWAFIVDYVRAHVVYHFGGIYLDTDVEVIKSFNNLLNNTCFSGFEDEIYINPGSIFAGEKGCLIAKELMEFYSHYDFINPDGEINQTPSPVIFSNLLRKHGIKLSNSYQELEYFTVYPAEYFCPKSFSSGLINTTNNTYSIHNFTGSWLSGESSNEIENRWAFYHKIGHDKQLIDIYEMYEEQIKTIKKNCVQNLSLKYLYKYVFRRTINKIARYLENFLKKFSIFNHNTGSFKSTNNCILFSYYGFIKKKQVSLIPCNLGDYFQTIATKAALQETSYNFIYHDRDSLSNYKGPSAICIMQGWFSHTNDFLPSNNILPVFIGTHLSRKAQLYLLQFSLYDRNYFSNMEIGCRDLYTLDFCRRNNIKAYFSRCLTLTLPRREPSSTQNQIFFIDFPKSIRKYIPDSIKKDAIDLNQIQNDISLITDYRKSELTAQNLLYIYSSQAKLVLTQRLHTALCCLAMGIPFVLIELSDDHKKRFSVLKGLINYYTLDDFSNNNVNYDFFPPNIEELKLMLLENLHLSIAKTKGDLISNDRLTILRSDIEKFSVTSFS
jgi:hypothetical protein